MADNEPTAAEYAEYLALAEKATVEPWLVCRETDFGGGLGMPVCRMDDDDALTVGHPHDWGPTAPVADDAAFIASSRRIGPAAARRMNHLETLLRSLYSAATENDNDISPLLLRDIEDALNH